MEHGTPAESGSCLLRTRTVARALKTSTPNTRLDQGRIETEQPFHVEGVVSATEPLTPLKGADIGPHALQVCKEPDEHCALPSSARGGRVEFSEPDFRTILKHSPLRQKFLGSTSPSTPPPYASYTFPRPLNGDE